MPDPLYPVQSYGQLMMTPRIKDMYVNQTEILLWLIELGHEVDDEAAMEEALDDQYVWVVV